MENICPCISCGSRSVVYSSEVKGDNQICKKTCASCNYEEEIIHPIIRQDYGEKMGKKKRKDKEKHEKHWKSTKSYNRGKTKIVHGKYLSKNVE